jgi:hypothetical protein
VRSPSGGRIAGIAAHVELRAIRTLEDAIAERSRRSERAVEPKHCALYGRDHVSKQRAQPPQRGCRAGAPVDSISTCTSQLSPIV